MAATIVQCNVVPTLTKINNDWFFQIYPIEFFSFRDLVSPSCCIPTVIEKRIRELTHNHVSIVQRRSGQRYSPPQKLEVQPNRIAALLCPLLLPLWQ